MSELHGTTESQAVSLFAEMERPFWDMRARWDTLDVVVANQYDYSTDLPLELDQRRSMGPSTLRRSVAMAKARLRSNIALHLEPIHGARESAADKMEVMQAHMLYRLDPYGHHMDDQNFYMAKGPFWAGWLEMAKFHEPERWPDESDEDYSRRLKKAKEQFFPFELLGRDPLSVAFMEYGRRKTIGGFRIKIPYIDILERFGSSYEVSRKDPQHMLTVCNNHFGFLRTDEARPYSMGEWNEFAGSVGEVCVVADDSQINYYFNLEYRRNSNLTLPARKDHKLQLEGLGDSIDNPFGIVPLFTCEGVYNPGATVAYRREGILHSLIETEYAKGYYKSLFASQAASPPKRYQQLPESIASEVIANQELMPGAPQFIKEGKPVIPTLLGTMRQLENPVDEMADKLYSILSEETARVDISGVLLDPEASQRLQNIPVSSILAQQDAISDLFGEAHRSRTNMLNDMLDACMTAYQRGLNSHREKGSPKSESDWGYSFRTTGKEGVKGKEIKPGIEYDVTPREMEAEYIRSIEPVDTRAASRSQKRAEADHALAMGAITYDKWLEAYDVSNITEFKSKKYEETMFQANAPRLMMDVRIKLATYTAIMNQSTLQQELAGLDPAAMSQASQAFSQEQGYAANSGSNMNMIQVAAPQQNNIPAGSGSTMEV